MSSAPVFIVGCPRSGTTLLYHMLLSSGGFAHFRAETRAYNTILPAFGSFAKRANRKRFVEHWTTTHHFRLTGLEGDWVRRAIVDGCSTIGGFLDAVMGEMARREGVARWAECTPGHGLHIPRILAELPEAKILHVIRDGRDVALSIDRLGWIRPFPFDRTAGLAAAAAHWFWLVRRARAAGRRHARAYREVRFEDLVERPRATLAIIGEFIEHDLDYDAIQDNAVGSVSRPNTSFSEESRNVSPVGRWERALTASQLDALERMLHPLLLPLNYRVTATSSGPTATARRLSYGAWFEVKQRLKSETPLGRHFTSLEHLEDGLPLEEDPRS